MADDPVTLWISEAAFTGRRKVARRDTGAIVSRPTFVPIIVASALLIVSTPVLVVRTSVLVVSAPFLVVAIKPLFMPIKVRVCAARWRV